MKFRKLQLIMLVTFLALSITTRANSSNPRGDTPEARDEFQQNNKISGRVIDKTGFPVSGATIVVKNTTRGTAAAADGSFTMTLQPGDNILVVSFIGMKNKEVVVTESTQPITIVLEDEDQMLEDVIVTGYGTFKKSAYAGSASSVKTEALKDVPTTNVAQMLQGTTSGVTLSGSSNQPGSAVSIRIRGMGSFNASNNPLYVIDGVPVASGNVSATGSDGGFDIMTTLNPSDIESMTVIKDAAAASLYGSRAANGVILIQTKSGKKGKANFSFKTDWGFTDFAMDYRTPMGGQERRDLIYEGLINQATIQDGKTAEEAITYANENIDEYAPVPWSGFADWTDILFRKGSHKNYEFSANGGDDKMKYYTSVGYTDQEGVSYQQHLERITARLNVSYQLTEKLELGAKMMFSEVKQDVNGEGGTYTSPLYSSRNTVTPSNAPFNEDGTYATFFPRNGDRNPKATADLNFDQEHITRALNTVYGEYVVNKNIKLRSTFNYDFSMVKGKSWRDPRTSDGEDDNGRTDKAYDERKYMVWSNTASYEKTFAEKHGFDAVVGYEIDSRFSDGLSGAAIKFANSEKNEISNGAVPYAVGGSFSNNRMVSYISKVNYNYDSRYFLGASFRRDGSSKLPTKNRWGNFWSVSGAWRIGDEAFMQNTSDVITDMKLRASYGVNATLPSDYYGYLSLTSFGRDYNNMPGTAETQIAYNDLKWETNYNFNLGLDITLFNRIDVTAEFYNRETKDLLIDKPISFTTGFTSILTNEGSMLNRGVELEILTRNIQRKEFSWTTSLNLGHNKNEILKLDGIQKEIPSGSYIRKVGYSYYTLFLREYVGINPENGMPQFYTNHLDADGNLVKEITEDPAKANAVIGKTITPKLTGGFNNQLNYKFIDLGFTFTFAYGGYSYDSGAQKLEHGGSEPDANIPIYYRNRWKKPGDNAKYEVFIVDNEVNMNDWSSTRRVHSTDHLRLKNLTVGMTLPKRWAEKANLTKARLFCSATNLWTLAAYDDYDPEVPTSGTVYFELPALKTVTFGVELNF
ncbi:MAG: SusC/RagA family TonB-linked outer membrane protein [Breznakibacter sp.]